jgi:hypothetical protein
MMHVTHRHLPIATTKNPREEEEKNSHPKAEDSRREV